MAIRPKFVAISAIAVVAALLLLLIAFQSMASRSCRISIINNDAHPITRISILQVGQSDVVAVFENVPADTTTVRNGRFRPDCEGLARIETDSGVVEASLGTVSGTRISEARITIEGGQVIHVHYR